jgi:peptidoglycan hydrolase-like protein with peptidoglycan-binding domain
MSANRLSWIVAAAVVLVVGFLVFRTVRTDNSSRSAPVASAQPEGADAATSARRVHPDSQRVLTMKDRESSLIRAKRALQERGFYNGPLDTTMNAEVVEALKKFQASVGMKPTGYLDPKTYEALGVELHRKRK